MKKKWTVFSLVILLIQYFSPLVAVAESISTPTNSFSVNSLVVGDQGNLDPNEVKLTVKGQVESITAQQQTITLTGVSALTPGTGTVVNPSQTAIGTYQANGQSLQVNINEGVSGSYELHLNSQLLDKTTPQQSLSAGTSQQSVTAPITLKTEQVPVEEPSEKPVESEQPVKEETTTPTKEATTDTAKQPETDKQLKQQMAAQILLNI